MTSGELKNVCEQVAPLLVFYACGELDDSEQALVHQHLAACAACSAQLSEERNLQTLLASFPQDADRLDSAAVLLSQWRGELAESLVDLLPPPGLAEAPGVGA